MCILCPSVDPEPTAPLPLAPGPFLQGKREWKAALHRLRGAQALREGRSYAGSRAASRCGCRRTSRLSFPPSVGEDGGGRQGCVRALGCTRACPLRRAHGLVRWQVPLPGQLHRRAHPAQPQCSPRACSAHLFHPGWGRPDRQEGQGQKADPNRGHTRTRRTAHPPALSCCGPGPWSNPSENTKVREGEPLQDAQQVLWDPRQKQGGWGSVLTEAPGSGLS